MMPSNHPNWPDTLVWNTADNKTQSKAVYTRDVFNAQPKTDTLHIEIPLQPGVSTVTVTVKRTV